MFLSKSAFDDAPADNNSRPRTGGGFNTVSKALSRPGTSGGVDESTTSGLGRHGVSGVDSFRMSVGPGAGKLPSNDDRRDRTPSGGTSGDIGSAGTLPTSAEARNSAMDRQKQLYAKRRTEIATGGMFTASRPIDGPGGIHSTTTGQYTPSVPQFSAPKSFGDATTGRPSTAGSSMSFATGRPTTPSETLDTNSSKTSTGSGTVLVGSRLSNDDRRGGTTKPQTSPTGDLDKSADVFVPSPEPQQNTAPVRGSNSGKLMVRSNRESSRDDDAEDKTAPPTRTNVSRGGDAGGYDAGLPNNNTRGGGGSGVGGVTYSRRPGTASNRGGGDVSTTTTTRDSRDVKDTGRGDRDGGSGGVVSGKSEITDAERELASRGLASTFDPNPTATTTTGSSDAIPSAMRVRTGGMGPASVDLSDMNAFLTQPTPKAVGIVQCYIERDKAGLGKKMYPVYQLYLKEGDRFLLAGKKRPKQKTSNYLISRSAEDLGRDSENFMGKLRSNFVGTEFTVYDDGVNPEDTKKTPGKDIRRELACCTYASNVFGSRGPRKMRVFVPRVFPDNTRADFQPASDKEGLLASVNKNETMNVVQLINKPPKWNEQVGAYVLNFNGRVTMASVKNFQLVPSDDHDTVVLQFGRVGKDLFTMDYQWPLSPLQAFAICLSSFDYKLACE